MTYVIENHFAENIARYHKHQNRCVTERTGALGFSQAIGEMNGCIAQQNNLV